MSENEQYLWRKPACCKVCGKTFYPENRERWAYRRVKDNTLFLFCTWSCLRAYDKKKESRKLSDMDRDNRDLENARRYYWSHREEIKARRKQKYHAAKEAAG